MGVLAQVVLDSPIISSSSAQQHLKQSLVQMNFVWVQDDGETQFLASIHVVSVGGKGWTSSSQRLTCKRVLALFPTRKERSGRR